MSEKQAQSFAPPPGKPSGRSRRKRTGLRVAVLLVAGLSGTVGALQLVATDAWWALTVANMMLPWVALGTWLSALLGLWERQWLPALLAAAAALLASWPVYAEMSTAGPLGTPLGTPAESELRVLTANLYVDNLRHEAAIDSLLGADADVLCLQEVTHAWQLSLEQRGVLERYPHHRIESEDSPFGIALFSRRPAEIESYVDAANITQLRAQIAHGEHFVTVRCVHLMPPLLPGLHDIHVRGGGALLDAVAQEDEPERLLVVGDFNSTPYNALHDSLTNHLTDAWNAAGSGFGHTAPANLSAVPPMRVDHAYVGAALRVTGARLLPGVGSDHNPLVVELAEARASGR